MREKRLKVYFYATENGVKPVRNWLASLDKADRIIMGLTLQKIEFGWPVGLPYCKPLGGGLWEARCSFPSKTIGRIIFAIIGNEMVLLNGFIKKTQKTPKDELDLARNRLRVSAHERLH